MTEPFRCPVCGEYITAEEDWKRHHSLRGRLERKLWIWWFSGRSTRRQDRALRRFRNG